MLDELDGNLVAFLLGDREADLFWDGLLHLDGNGVIWGRGAQVRDLFDLDGVLEAHRLREVLALLLRHVHRDVGALLGGDRLAPCLWDLKRNGHT